MATDENENNNENANQVPIVTLNGLKQEYFTTPREKFGLDYPGFSRSYRFDKCSGPMVLSEMEITKDHSGTLDGYDYIGDLGYDEKIYYNTVNHYKCPNGYISKHNGRAIPPGWRLFELRKGHPRGLEYNAIYLRFCPDCAHLFININPGVKQDDKRFFRLGPESLSIENNSRQSIRRGHCRYNNKCRKRTYGQNAGENLTFCLNS